MTHIFISYSKKDTRELALALTDALNQIEGVSAWVDRSLRAGKSWELQIQSEIDRCDTMLVLYSPDINRHKNGEAESYVLNEIAYAKWTAKKPIIPIMAQATDPPISLTMEHYIDFTRDGLALDDLVMELCEELGVEAGHPNLASTSLLPQQHLRSQDIEYALIASLKWIEIPAGKVTLVPDEIDMKESYLKLDTTIDVPAFTIAKYPVTNAQYAKFIEAGGYHQSRWWTEAGWWQREQENWTEPLCWTDTELNNAEQPVVGISWYEAIAFCLALSEMEGKQITLPTDTQWQWAAQGDDDRNYPWGNERDSGRCNTLESGIGKTTFVGHYEEAGSSPFGVVDMAGNTWEWCLTDYEFGINYEDFGARLRVLRGGSWLNYQKSMRDRQRNSPNYRDYSVGFRLVRL